MGTSEFLTGRHGRAMDFIWPVDVAFVRGITDLKQFPDDLLLSILVDTSCSDSVEKT
jgi:hypothetical protein